VNSKYLLTILGALPFAMLMQLAAQSNTPPPSQKAAPAVAKASQQHQDEGARIFQQNCSRCHNTPDGFSPRISGTIVKHMRVRASLSKHDEEALLRFFNP
jgi:mono/diheme cytochrome c family protein